MQLSDCLYINHLGVLLYKGHRGIWHEVVGYTGNDLNLRRYQ